MSAVTVLASRPEIIQLLQWCHQRSGEFAKKTISPAEFGIVGGGGSYRGICAVKRIAEGSEILFMPEKVLISSHNFPCQLEMLEYLNLQEKFAIFVLIEAHNQERSQYAPYVETLPSDFSCHHPGYLNDGEMGMFPKWCSELLRKQKSLVKSGYEKSKKYLEIRFPNESNHVSYDKYQWAWYTVNTRTVFFMKQSVDGTSEKEMALAPFLDLFNHAPEPNTQVSYRHGVGYSITAIREILPKEQIFISYGPHPNHKLWSEYGFIPGQTNPYNYIPFDWKSGNGHVAKFKWLRETLKDKRKLAMITEHRLMEELCLLENEFSPNLELLIEIALWDPSFKFSFCANKRSEKFLGIAKEIIEVEKESLESSVIFLRDSSSVCGVSEFLKDCITLCDKLYNYYETFNR